MKFRNWFFFPHVWNYRCNLYLWTKATDFDWNLDNFFNCLCIEMEHNAYKHMILLICVMYVGLWWAYLFSNELWFHNHTSDNIALNHWFMAPLHFPNVTHLNLFFLGHMSPSMCFFFCVIYGYVFIIMVFSPIAWIWLGGLVVITLGFLIIVRFSISFEAFMIILFCLWIYNINEMISTK